MPSTYVKRPFTQPSTLLNGLRERWSFDEVTGAARVGSMAGISLADHNSVPQIAGKLVNAASFNGTTQRLDVADNATVSFANTTPLTIVQWLNPTTLINGATPINKGGLIIGATSFEYALEFLLQLGNINLLFLLSNNAASSPTTCSAGVLTTGVWSLIIAWYDPIAGGSMNIRLNNGTTTTIALGVPVGGSSDQTHAFNIGSSGAGGAFYQGGIDETLLYDRVLTFTEQSSLWNGGAGFAWPF